MYDEEPEDPHGECNEEIRRLEAELQDVRATIEAKEKITVLQDPCGDVRLYRTREAAAKSLMNVAATAHDRRKLMEFANGVLHDNGAMHTEVQVNARHGLDFAELDECGFFDDQQD